MNALQFMNWVSGKCCRANLWECCGDGGTETYVNSSQNCTPVGSMDWCLWGVNAIMWRLKKRACWPTGNLHLQPGRNSFGCILLDLQSAKKSFSCCTTGISYSADQRQSWRFFSVPFKNSTSLLKWGISNFWILYDLAFSERYRNQTERNLFHR